MWSCLICQFVCPSISPSVCLSVSQSAGELICLLESNITRHHCVGKSLTCFKSTVTLVNFSCTLSCNYVETQVAQNIIVACKCNMPWNEPTSYFFVVAAIVVRSSSRSQLYFVQIWWLQQKCCEMCSFYDNYVTLPNIFV